MSAVLDLGRRAAKRPAWLRLACGVEGSVVSDSNIQFKALDGKFKALEFKALDGKFRFNSKHWMGNQR